MTALKVVMIQHSLPTSEYYPESDDDTKPHLLSQSDLNDLVRDLQLTKEQSELLGSRLQQWNLLDGKTRISDFRNRSKKLSCFYDVKDKLCFCSDIEGLLRELGCEHKLRVETVYRFFKVES